MPQASFSLPPRRPLFPPFALLRLRPLRLRPPRFTAATVYGRHVYGRPRLRPLDLRPPHLRPPRFTAATFTATLVYGRPIYGGHVTREPARIPPFYQCAIGHCIFLVLVLQSPPLCFWVPRHPRFVPLLSFPYLGVRKLNRRLRAYVAPGAPFSFVFIFYSFCFSGYYVMFITLMVPSCLPRLMRPSSCPNTLFYYMFFDIFIYLTIYSTFLFVF